MQQLQTNLLLSCSDEDCNPLFNDTCIHLPLHSSPTSVTASTPIWFKEYLSRDGAKKVLKMREEGSFVVRKSAKRDCFALSIVVPLNQPESLKKNKQTKVVHYLIESIHSGFRIKGFGKEFQSLQALVTHHSVMKEKLPVVLRLDRSKEENVEINNNHQKRIDDYDDLENLDKLIKGLNLSQFDM